MNTLAFVSRRAAGVWTHLPSLTIQLLDSIPGNTSVLWIDFGQRFEMLNHLAIDPAAFPRASSLVGLMDALESGQEDISNNVVGLSETILPDNASEHGLSRLRGSGLREYREAFRGFQERGGRIYTVPREVPGAQRALLDIDLLEAVLARLSGALRPIWTALTFEGQPETQIFRRILKEDTVLRWALRVSSAIVSLVRFDAPHRFRDGVGILAELAREPDLRSRLLVLLTRCSDDPVLTKEIQPYFLGGLPFAGFIGVSVNAGRVPLLDILSKPREKRSAAEQEYRTRLEQVVEELQKRLKTKG